MTVEPRTARTKARPALRAISIFDEVKEERARQERLKIEGRFTDTCASPSMPNGVRLAVLMEEVGEVARAVLEEGYSNDKHGKDLRKELIQVAAVAVA